MTFKVTDSLVVNNIYIYIITELSNKVNTSALSSHATVASPTFSGTVGGLTKTMVQLGSVDNTSDLLKPTSTATKML